MTTKDIIGAMASKSSLQYWHDREETQKAHNITDLDEYNAELGKIYAQAITDCEAQINDWYMRYADKEGISMAEAKKRVATADQKYYAQKAEEYVANKDLSPTANSEMRLYNLTMKVNRLELLKANLGMAVTAAGSDAEKLTGNFLDKKALEELQRQAGILGKGIGNQDKLAENIVNASFKNATFSERIWNDVDALRQRINIQVQRSLIRGMNPVEIARGFLPELRSDVEKTRYATERLARTEMCRVLTDAQMQSFKQNGYDEYVVICEATACDICKPHDGQHYKIDDMAVAENAPPFHPNCLCSTAAWMDENELEQLIKEIEAENAGGAAAAEPTPPQPTIPPPAPPKSIDTMNRTEIKNEIAKMEKILSNPAALTFDEYSAALDRMTELKMRRATHEHNTKKNQTRAQLKKATEKIAKAKPDEEYTGIYKDPIKVSTYNPGNYVHSIDQKISYFEGKWKAATTTEDKAHYGGLLAKSRSFKKNYEAYNAAVAEIEKIKNIDAVELQRYRNERKELPKLDKERKSLLLDNYRENIVLSLIDENFVYEDIWSGGVTVKDYKAKQSKIQAKKDYYTKKETEALDAGDSAAYKKYSTLYERVRRFEQEGKEYFEQLEKIEANNAKIKELDAKIEALRTGKAAVVTNTTGTNPSWLEESFQQAVINNSKTFADTQSAESYNLKVKNFDRDVWDNTLTADERSAIYDYTDGYYTNMNDAIREKKVDGHRYEKQIKDCNIGLMKFEVKEDYYLHRGCGRGHSMMKEWTGLEWDELNKPGIMEGFVGQIVTDSAFMSCGASEQAAWSGLRLDLYVPKGTRGMYVNPISAHRGEGELLLPRNSRIKILSFERNSYGEIREVRGILVGQG